MKAIELDSTHNGAHHLIGAWHAEVKRLSGFQKFFAKALFGGGFLDKGNWDDAQRYLERAVALKPQNIFHRLELAEVYVDVGKYSKAREQLTALATLPIADVLDHTYQHNAAQLLGMLPHVGLGDPIQIAQRRAGPNGVEGDLLGGEHQIVDRLLAGREFPVHRPGSRDVRRVLPPLGRRVHHHEVAVARLAAVDVVMQGGRVRPPPHARG